MTELQVLFLSAVGLYVAWHLFLLIIWLFFTNHDLNAVREAEFYTELGFTKDQNGNWRR